MKKLPLLILTILLLAAGCGRRDSRRVTKWPTEGGLIDSLTDRFEYEAVAGEIDSMQATFLRLRQASADSAKMLFLEARLMRAMRDFDSSAALMARLDLCIDTARQKYLWQRVKQFHARALNDDAQKYMAFISALKYYRDVKDSMLAAHTLVDISNLMLHLKDPEAALATQLEAQSIYSSLNMPIAANRCNINLLNIYRDLNDTLAVDSVSALLLADSSLLADTVSLSMALLNAYNVTDSIKLLRKAYSLVAGRHNLRHIQPLFMCIIGDHYWRAGEKDSAHYYIRRAHDMLPYCRDILYRGHFTRSYVRVLEDEGKLDSAYYYLLIAEQYNDTTMSLESGFQVQTMEANRKLAELKNAEQEKMHRERQMWTLALMAALAAIAAVAWLAYRNHQRGKMRAVQAELELERSRHHLAARVMAMEEKDKLLSTMSRGLKEMSQNPEESRVSARELENMIKLHVAGQEEWQNFVTLFEKANPEFMAALKEGYPDLAEHYVKLAAYIYAGLTSAQIARLLMIRPESVHQARWRLRKRLGLSPDVSLEDALRALRK